MSSGAKAHPPCVSSGRPARRPGIRLGARSLLLLGLVALLAACGRTDLPLDALSPDGPIARQQDDLWNLVFPISVVIFILVQGMILFAVVRFRAKGDEQELPKQVHGNTRLEIVWTAIPALILAAVAVPMVQTIFALEREPDPDDRVDVSVVGKQYFWQFEYPDEGVLTANEMVIPTGTPVYVHLDGIGEHTDAAGNTQRDRNLVLHSFWVPRLAGKVDFAPGHDRFLTIQADEPGRYLGQCAEFCGLSHANMRFRVVAVSPAEYEQWLQDQAEPAAAPDSELAQQGEDLFGQNCVACHAVQGHPANGGSRIGPDLTHFASREEFAGAIFAVEDEEQLRRWIRNPQAEKPGAQMLPFSGLSEQELDALIAYLYSLE